MNDQRSVADQLRDAVRLCTEAGMYDAADAIQRTFKLRRDEPFDLAKAETVMPFVDGKRFFCPCGCGVFTRYGARYRCNACPNEFVGDGVETEPAS